jgi:hypothetical protein
VFYINIIVVRSRRKREMVEWAHLRAKRCRVGVRKPIGKRFIGRYRHR